MKRQLSVELSLGIEQNLVWAKTMRIMMETARGTASKSDVEWLAEYLRKIER